MLRIIEIFPSLQGEGLRQGESTIFIRLAGCNLRCSFCDTRRAWGKGKEYPVERIVEEVELIRKHFPTRWVCLTGGEPLLQDLGELVRLLKKRKLKVQLETNATRYAGLPFDWITISPKPKAYAFCPEYKHTATEVKLIVTRELRLQTIKKFRRAFPAKTPILLQPQSNRLWSLKSALALVEKSLASGLENIRLSLQMHKIIGLP